MKVLLLGNYLSDRQESMQRFATLMQEGLTEHGHDVMVLRPPAVVGRLLPGARGVSKWLGYLDKYLLFPLQLRSAASGVEVVHICDHSNAMYSQWCGDTPCVVTCHDMLAVRGAMGEQTDCPASFTGRWLQRWIVRGLSRAGMVASVSSATSADVEKIVGGPEHTRCVILNARNYPYRRISREEARERLQRATALDLSRPYVMHVGSNLERKNRPGVIRSFALASREADLQLVLVGPELNAPLKELLRTEGIAERTTVVVKPDNDVLEALYNLALALFFPSRYEGFGWPLIEAQACGCPVICSRCAPFAEVVESSAIVRSVEDEQGFAEDILRLARDPSERNMWVERGMRNAARFDRGPMIAGYLDVYRKLAARQ
jgi:glycosyltransferase involved in cell wall biosynthesis